MVGFSQESKDNRDEWAALGVGNGMRKNQVSYCLIFPSLFTAILLLRIRKGNIREETLLRNGISVEAVLLSMTETGTTMNNAPEIEMELSLNLPDGGTRVVRHRCFVSILNLARLSPGDRLQVTMDPEDPDRMVVITSKVIPESD